MSVSCSSRWVRSSMGKLKAVAELFEGRHFDREVIILCVRWYLRFKLSLRDLVEMMAERGLSMAHTTIMRWVQRYAPRNAGAGLPGRSASHWRVDRRVAVKALRDRAGGRASGEPSS
jgi:transposase-like protein